MADEPLPTMIFQCGPSTLACKCACADHGPCQHTWDGPIEEGLMDGGGHYSTTTCSRCGMTSMDHDMWLF